MTSNNNDNKDIKKDDKFNYMKKAEEWVGYICTFIFAASVMAFICWAFSLGH